MKRGVLPVGAVLLAAALAGFPPVFAREDIPVSVVQTLDGPETIRTEAPEGGLQDTEPPVLESVEGPSAGLKPGDTAVLLLKITDNLSGVDSFDAFIADSQEKMVFVCNSLAVYDAETEKYRWEFEIPNGTPDGTYTLKKVTVRDKQENSRTLLAGDGENPLPDAVSFAVSNPDGADAEAPELKEVTVNPSAVDAGQAVTFQFRAEDDLSGVKSLCAIFRSAASGREIRLDLSGEDFKPDSGLYAQTYQTTSNEYGTYELNSVEISDRLNHIRTVTGDELPKPLPSFEIRNSVQDTEPPVLESLTAAPETVEAPGGTLTVTAGASDDLSGVKEAVVRFRNGNSGRVLTVPLSASGTTLTGTLSPEALEPSGEFVVDSVELSDRSGNSRVYSQDGETPLPESLKNVRFGIRNVNTQPPPEEPEPDPAPSPEGTLDLSDTDLAGKIRTGTQDSYAVKCPENGVVPAEVFRAMMDAKKNVVFQLGSVEWSFEGASLVAGNLKDVDLSLRLTILDNATTDSAKAIRELTKGKPAVLLSFADNGILPGKAKISVHSGNIQALGADGLTIYFYDPEKKALTTVMENASLTGGELQFTILHNSDYVVTAGAVSEGQRPDPPNPPDPNPKPETTPDPVPDSKPPAPSPAPPPAPPVSSSEPEPPVSSTPTVPSLEKTEEFNWNTIRRQIRDAYVGDNLVISVPDEEKIPSSILKAAADKQLTLALSSGKQSVILTRSDLAAISSYDALRETYSLDAAEDLKDMVRDGKIRKSSSAEEPLVIEKTYLSDNNEQAAPSSPSSAKPSGEKEDVPVTVTGTSPIQENLFEKPNPATGA